MLRSLALGLGLETFAKFFRVSVSKNLVSEKSLGFGKNWSRKKVSISVSENLVSEEKYRFRFRKNLVSEKSLGFGFGKFGIVKKVSVSVSVKLLVSSFSVQVVEVVRMISLDDIHSENIWFSWYKPSNY